MCRITEGNVLGYDPLSKAGRVPTETPPFTLKDLKQAIPPHCFKRSLWKSSAYLLGDILMLFASLYIAVLYARGSNWMLNLIPNLVFWPFYWAFTGCVATGVWVIAHECGHDAFSESSTINDAVGLVLHSALLVPYFSWKFSHRRHHQNTASLERDEVFVPHARDEDMSPAEDSSWIWPVRLFYIVMSLTIGWPLYLIFNVASRPYDRWANHFSPSSPIFNEKQRSYIIISDVGMLAAQGVLFYVSYAYGVSWLMASYGIPYLIVNMWLVLITQMQHTHPKVPHYRGSEWDWLRGALATVDRDYGMLNYIFHRITDTHVVHHLFSKMPFYHAAEATKAVRPILGEYYMRDDRNIWEALWKDYNYCRFVRPDKDGPNDVLWYTNH